MFGMKCQNCKRGLLRRDKVKGKKSKARTYHCKVCHAKYKTW